jgi:hypothetical protein
MVQGSDYRTTDHGCEGPMTCAEDFSLGTRENQDHEHHRKHARSARARPLRGSGGILRGTVKPLRWPIAKYLHGGSLIFNDQCPLSWRRAEISNSSIYISKLHLGYVDGLDRNRHDIAGDIVSRAETPHLLGFCHPADHSNLLRSLRASSSGSTCCAKNSSSGS